MVYCWVEVGLCQSDDWSVVGRLHEGDCGIAVTLVVVTFTAVGYGTSIGGD
jgi:hypothetical protein